MHTHDPPTVLPWSEDLRFARDLLIDGNTWKPPILPILHDPTPTKLGARGVERGRKGYKMLRLPAGQPLDTWRGQQRAGSVRFTTDIGIPVLYHAPDSLEVWMSYTPMEVFSCRSGVRFARGHVILGGLGIGWMLDRIARKPGVESVRVIEIDRDLVEWYGRRMCDQLSRETGKPVTIRHGDVHALAREHTNPRSMCWVLDVWKQPPYRDSLDLQWFRDRQAPCWAWTLNVVQPHVRGRS